MTEKEEINFDEMSEEEILKTFTDKGFELSSHFEKKPFVEWDNTKIVKGFVTESKIIPSKYPDPETGERKQKICSVGEFSINCSGVLKDVDMYAGMEIAIIRSDEKTVSSTSGKDYWTFHVIPLTKRAK